MTSTDPRILAAMELIEIIPDFPKPGVRFLNLFPVMRNPDVYSGIVDLLVEDIRAQCPDVDLIAGLELRGFMLGPTVAHMLGVGFVPVRKGNKLPGEKHRVEYALEYGKDVFEIQKNSVQKGQKVVIMDDLFSTGGTMRAACDLMEMAGARVLAGVAIIGSLNERSARVMKYPLISYIKGSRVLSRGGFPCEKL